MAPEKGVPSGKVFSGKAAGREDPLSAFVSAEGWRRFCADLGIDAEALGSALGESDAFRRATETATLFAPDEEGMLRLVKRLGWAEARAEGLCPAPENVVTTFRAAAKRLHSDW